MNGYTFLKVFNVKMDQKKGYPIPVKKFFKDDAIAEITADSSEVLVIVKASLEEKFEGVKIDLTLECLKL